MKQLTLVVVPPNFMFFVCIINILSVPAERIGKPTRFIYMYSLDIYKEVIFVWDGSCLYVELTPSMILVMLIFVCTKFNQIFIFSKDLRLI